jgi:hypothetical protein
MGRKPKGVLAIRNRIVKDAKKTIEANSPGGRYFRPTIGDKVTAARAAATEKKGL